MNRIILCSLLVAIFSAPVVAQHHDSDITISIDNADIDIEAFFEELGASLEEALSGLSETDADISISIDEEQFEYSMEKFGESMEKLGESIEHAVKNMSIELKNLDADEIKRNGGNVNGRSLRDILEEVEDEYSQEVETVDRLLMKFRENGLYMEMDVTLESGKEIRNIRKTIDD